MPGEKLVKILSIDGGGIRGIIPALVLAELESLTGKPACELFDLVAGTSTGGIIALGVTVPGPVTASTAGAESEHPAGRDGVRAAKRPPRWSARDLAGLYEEDGPKIFHRSLLRTIETVGGLLSKKYSAHGLEAMLANCLGDARLDSALTRVLITSYDIQKHEPFFFKSFQPRARTPPSSGVAAPSPIPATTLEYPMKVVGRATSAAPTYFEPEPVPILPASPGGTSPGYALVDGGTFANNPAMCAYAEALRDDPNAKVLIVSLGTGRLTESISYRRARRWGLLQWARPLLGVIMDGSSAAIDYQLDELLGPDTGHFRFQAILEGASDSLDDASPTNIANLRKVAEALIDESTARLATVASLLTSDDPGDGASERDDRSKIVDSAQRPPLSQASAGLRAASTGKVPSRSRTSGNRSI